MSELSQKMQAAVHRINAAIRLYNPLMVVGLFSGGHDSLTACYIASLADRFDGCLHINTGTGIAATRDFCFSTCDSQRWPIREFRAVDNTTADGKPDPMDYADIVLKNGFPGPNAHRFFYIKLKERALRCFYRSAGATAERPVMFISGARSQESERRMGNTKTEPFIDGVSVWVNGIHDFSKLDTSAVITVAKLERNRVVDLIHRSGECNCGAYAQRGELQELSLWAETRPTYEYLMDLQARVVRAGFPWGWEDPGPPEWFMQKKGGQLFLLDYDDPDVWELPLCHNCNIGQAPLRRKEERRSLPVNNQSELRLTA